MGHYVNGVGRVYGCGRNAPGRRHSQPGASCSSPGATRSDFQLRAEKALASYPAHSLRCHCEYPRARAALCQVKELAAARGRQPGLQLRSPPAQTPQTVPHRAGCGACSPVPGPAAAQVPEQEAAWGRRRRNPDWRLDCFAAVFMTFGAQARSWKCLCSCAVCCMTLRA